MAEIRKYGKADHIYIIWGKNYRGKERYVGQRTYECAGSKIFKKNLCSVFFFFWKLHSSIEIMYRRRLFIV